MAGLLAQPLLHLPVLHSGLLKFLLSAHENKPEKAALQLRG